jgi:hypothetical protein
VFAMPPVSSSQDQTKLNFLFHFFEYSVLSQHNLFICFLLRWVSFATQVTFKAKVYCYCCYSKLTVWKLEVTGCVWIDGSYFRWCFNLRTANIVEKYSKFLFINCKRRDLGLLLFLRQILCRRVWQRHQYNYLLRLSSLPIWLLWMELWRLQFWEKSCS